MKKTKSLPDAAPTQAVPTPPVAAAATSRTRAGRKPDPSAPRSRYRVKPTRVTPEKDQPIGPMTVSPAARNRIAARLASRKKTKARATEKAAERRRTKNPWNDRESAAAYVRTALDEYRKDYRRHKTLLEKGLKEIAAEIKQHGATVALIEGRASTISGLKTLQTNYTRFLLDITKSKNLLSNLDDNTATVGGAVINIVLPDFGAIPVVAITNAPPPGATTATEEEDDDGEGLDEQADSV